MKLKLILTAAVLTAAVVVPVGATAHHNPSHGGGPGATGLSIASDPNPVRFERVVTFSGRLTGQNNAGKVVLLEADAFPYEGNFVAVGSATTDLQGRWVEKDEPRVNTRYRARQGSTVSGVIGQRVRIRVSRRVSDDTPADGEVIRFRGRACPQHDGAEVRLQRRSPVTHKWRTKRTTTLKDIEGSTCSRYSKRVRVTSDAFWRVKVVSGDGDHANGFSRRKLIDVH